MKYVIFDTETTGTGNNDEVVEFGALITDASLKPLKLVDFYCYTSKSFHPEATAVSGLTQGKLAKLSNFDTFEDKFYEMSDIVNSSDVCWLAYGLPFDRRLVNQTLELNGLRKHDFGKSITTLNKTNGIYNFDVMRAVAQIKYKGINTKLERALLDLESSHGLKMESLKDSYSMLLNKSGIQQATAEFHSAAFDAYCTWVLIKAYEKSFRF